MIPFALFEDDVQSTQNATTNQGIDTTMGVGPNPSPSPTLSLIAKYMKKHPIKQPANYGYDTKDVDAQTIAGDGGAEIGPGISQGTP